jgi:hypothetical protein
VGTDHRERLQEIATKSAEIESHLAGLRTRFEKERDLVTTIRDLRSQLESAGSQNGNAVARTEIPESRPMQLRPAPAATAPTGGVVTATSTSATATAVEEAAKPVDVAAVRGNSPG